MVRYLDTDNKQPRIYDLRESNEFLFAQFTSLRN